MKNVLEVIIKAIVTKPEDVHINEREGENNTVILEISVNKEDMGRVIGSKGQNLDKITKVMHIVASKQQRRMHIDIIE